MDQKLVCVVTIHGIGFQQAPDDKQGIPGYADALHSHLGAYLDASYSGDDPKRTRSQRGEHGPVYVQSHWPPRKPGEPLGPSEAGLNRLGTWDQARTRFVNCSEVPLADGGRLAHVALIYSNLADLDPHLWAALETTAKGLIGFGHYTSVANLVRTAFVDLEAIFKHPAYERRAATPSLQVRRDLAPGQDPGGLVAVLERLQSDIATYICRNDLRERARGFVREALLRLCARDDVAGLVVNAHSQGTTVAYDVLRALPPSAARKVRHLVTAGSPLRKYSQLCYWGAEVGNICEMGLTGAWTNFWDPKDPVADPLAPPEEWLRGEDVPPRSQTASLYHSINTGTAVDSPVIVADEQVNNVENSLGGGLQAYNYWDNEPEVVEPLAGILRQLVAGGAE